MTAAPGGLAYQIEMAIFGEQCKGRFLHPRDVAQIAVAVMEQWGCPNCPDPQHEGDYVWKNGAELVWECADSCEHSSHDRDPNVAER